MFEQEKFWKKKCFANNRNDARINKKVVQCKIRSVRVIKDIEGFRFYIFY